MFKRTALTAALFLAFFAIASQGEARKASPQLKSVCRNCALIDMSCCFVNGAFHCC